jgi:hypothetical protein
MRRLEVLKCTLAQNTKYIVPSNSSLINVLGLDGITPVTQKPADGQMQPPSSPAGRSI